MYARPATSSHRYIVMFDGADVISAATLDAGDRPRPSVNVAECADEFT